MPNKPESHPPSSNDLLEQFLASRKYSLDLISTLSPEDCQAQSMPDASPAKWHLAHVTWFYEVMILKSFEKNFQYWNPEFAVLFNSYYNGVGDKHPRNKRGLLTRPSLAEVLQWRKNIDSRVSTLLKIDIPDALQHLIQIGIYHEQQHQELLLTDIQHLFFSNSLLPAYSPRDTQDIFTSTPFQWLEGNSGLVDIGFEAMGFHFDNEGPRHTAYLQKHYIGNQLVSNAQWLSFIEAGAYQDSRWWLDSAWSWLQAENISAPLYWNMDKDKDNQYWRFSLHGNLPIDLNAPVSNISYFEADAFARWAGSHLEGYAGARLPTEFEWESFASINQEKYELFGKVWQWTSSNYSPYPGYQPWSGIAGEYNGKFMVNQMVLRGSSAYTSQGHSRPSYRNFFSTEARWQMMGLRLAKDGI
jgi:ergothioneine biosynthesis protein EgtB